MRAGAVLLTALAGLTVSLPAHGNADLRPRGELMEAVIDLSGRWNRSTELTACSL